MYLTAVQTSSPSQQIPSPFFFGQGGCGQGGCGNRGLRQQAPHYVPILRRQANHGDRQIDSKVGSGSCVGMTVEENEEIDAKDRSPSVGETPTIQHLGTTGNGFQEREFSGSTRKGDKTFRCCGFQVTARDCAVATRCLYFSRSQSPRRTVPEDLPPADGVSELLHWRKKLTPGYRKYPRGARVSERLRSRAFGCCRINALHQREFRMAPGTP